MHLIEFFCFPLQDKTILSDSMMISCLGVDDNVYNEIVQFGLFKDTHFRKSSNPSKSFRTLSLKMSAMPKVNCTIINQIKEVWDTSILWHILFLKFFSFSLMYNTKHHNAIHCRIKLELLICKSSWNLLELLHIQFQIHQNF